MKFLDRDTVKVQNEYFCPKCGSRLGGEGQNECPNPECGAIVNGIRGEPQGLGPHKPKPQNMQNVFVLKNQPIGRAAARLEDEDDDDSKKKSKNKKLKELPKLEPFITEYKQMDSEIADKYNQEKYITDPLVQNEEDAQDQIDNTWNDLAGEE